MSNGAASDIRSLDISTITSGVIASGQTDEVARKAVKAFQKMMPTLTAYAKAFTGNPRIQVAVSATSGGATDGHRILLRPPLALGIDLTHDKRRCDLRDSSGKPSCDACAAREGVLVTIYHEIAHIAFKSFLEPTEDDKRLAFAQAMKRGRKAILEMVMAKGGTNWNSMLNVVNPFLPHLMNVLEDARVDASMFAKRPGTKVMFDYDVSRIFEQGFDSANPTTGEIEHVFWKDAPLNSQAMMGLYSVIAGYDYTDWFAPQIVTDLGDPKLRDLIKKVGPGYDARNIYELSFDVMDRLNELGYCVVPDSEEPPEEDDDDQLNAESDPESSGESEHTEPESNTDSDSSDDHDTDSDEGQPGPESDEEESDGEGATDGGEDNSSGDGDQVPPDGDSSNAGDGEGGSESSDSGDEEGGSVDDGASDPESGEGAESDGSGGEGDGGLPEPDDDASDGDQFESDEGAGSSDTGAGNDDSDSDRDPSVGGQPGGGSVDPSADLRSEGRASDEAGDEGDPDQGSPDGEGDQHSDADADERGEEPADSSESDDDGHEDGLGGDLEASDEADAGEVEPLDSGTWDGDEGVKTIEHGTPEQVEMALAQLGQHVSDEDRPDEIHTYAMEEADDAMAVAVLQGMYFETPSRNILGVREFFYEKCEDDKEASAWPALHKHLDKWDRQSYGIDGDFAIPEGMLAKALLRMRIAFADNARAKVQRNLKSGRVNARVLGKRVFQDEPRLFQKKRMPGRKDYFVAIHIDVSGSTIGSNILAEKRAVHAQAELLSRMGIAFSIEADTGDSNFRDERWPFGSYLDVYHVKQAHEPWDDRARTRLNELSGTGANLDGHALEYLRKQCDARSEQVKIILYYTDGAMPAANFDEELLILQREIALCRNKGYILLGVGIGTDSPVQHGLETVQLDSVDDTPKVVKQLERRLVVGAA